MKALLRIATTLALLMAAVPALAQSATPTETPTETPTATPTATPTSTPTLTPTLGKRAGALLWHARCPSPPCYSEDAFPDQGSGRLDDRGGHKTAIVSVVAGTATVALACSTPQSAEIYLASLSGANCDTPANCLKEFDTQCDDFKFKITACSGCLVDAWLRVDAGDTR